MKLLLRELEGQDLNPDRTPVFTATQFLQCLLLYLTLHLISSGRSFISLVIELTDTMYPLEVGSPKTDVNPLVL